MSEDQAYYQPQARIVQGEDRVWLIEVTVPQDGTLRGTMILEMRHGLEALFPFEGFTPEQVQGRDMVLVPKERIDAVDVMLDALGDYLMKVKNNPDVNDSAAVRLLPAIARLEQARQLLLGKGGDAK